MGEWLKNELKAAIRAEIERMQYELLSWLSLVLKWVSIIGVAMAQLGAVALGVWAFRNGRWRPKDAYEVAYLLIGLAAIAYVFKALG